MLDTVKKIAHKHFQGARGSHDWDHTLRVCRLCERLGSAEGVDLDVVLVAAYLHDIGIKEAERKHNSSSPQYQHLEGPPVAREILTRLGAEEGMIEEVCDIIGHHHTPRDEESINFKVVYDADLIVNLEEKQKESPTPPEHLEKIIAKSFLTKSGKDLARKVLLERD